MGDGWDGRNDDDQIRRTELRSLMTLDYITMGHYCPWLWSVSHSVPSFLRGGQRVSIITSSAQVFVRTTTRAYLQGYRLTVCFGFVFIMFFVFCSRRCTCIDVRYVVSHTGDFDIFDICVLLRWCELFRQYHRAGGVLKRAFIFRCFIEYLCNMGKWNGY